MIIPKSAETKLLLAAQAIAQRAHEGGLKEAEIKCKHSVNGLRFGNIVSKLRDLSKEHNLDFNLVVWRWKYESHIYKLKGAKPVPIQ